MPGCTAAPGDRYYTDLHVETVLRRAVASGLNPRKVADALTIFSGASRIEGVHPLQFGFVRRKVRTQRRHGMDVINPLLFYPGRALDASVVLWRWLALARRYRSIMKRVVSAPNAAAYIDHALTPPVPDESGMDEFVQEFASQLPKTYGARARHVAAA